jgi:pimeloyl-ACP methyl ester carboxylesterase
MPTGEVIRLQSSLNKDAGRFLNMDGSLHQPMFESFAYPGTRIYETNVEVDDNAIIRILYFQPQQASGKLPLMIVPGLSSVIESFGELLREITRTHEVFYVETREKPSSKVSKHCLFDMASFSRDVSAVVHQFGFKEDSYLLVGFSLGAAAIMEAYSGLEKKPACLLLAEPVPAFRFPRWTLPLAGIAPAVYPLLKPFAKWYIRHFMIDTRKDEEIMRIVERALNSADPNKLGRTLRSIHGFEAWQHLPHINTRTVIIATSMDTLHNHEDIMKMEQLLPNAHTIDLENNRRSHGVEVCEIIRSF